MEFQFDTTIAATGVLISLILCFRAILRASGPMPSWRRSAPEEHTYIKTIKANLRAKPQADKTPYALPWDGTRKFMVVGREPENPIGDIVSFYLAPYDGKPIPFFLPGQHLAFELPGLGEKKQNSRCYSLSISPNIQSRGGTQNFYRISVKRSGPPPRAPDHTPPGIYSNYFHDHLQKGALLDVYAPEGSFILDIHANRPVALIAGGVGITPLISMMNYLLMTNSPREIWLFYGVRNRAEHAMYDHLRWAEKKFANLNIVTFYSRPGIEDQPGIEYQFQGHINIEHIKTMLRTRNYEFYLCGPPAMMTTLITGLKHWGVHDRDVKFEAFGSSQLQTTPTPDNRTIENNAPLFNVSFTRSGKTVQTSQNCETILELAESNNIKARCGCRAGNCGTCLAVLKKGEVSYMQKPLREPEPGYCLPCIARAASDLVIDI